MRWRLSNRGKQSIDLVMYSDANKQGEVSRRDETGEQAYTGCDSAIRSSHDGCKPASHIPLFSCARIAEDDLSRPIGMSRGDMREDPNRALGVQPCPFRSLCAFIWLDIRLHVHDSTTSIALIKSNTVLFASYASSTQRRELVRLSA
jgi:hypothetical protein